MQIGIKVYDFANIDGVLAMVIKITFTHPNVPRGEISGSVPFRANNAQIEVAARQMIADNYGVVVPANADVQIR
jgi:hypothetical protein